MAGTSNYFWSNRRWEGTVELFFVLLDSTGDALEVRFDYSSTQDDWIPIDTVLISQQRDYEQQMVSNVSN